MALSACGGGSPPTAPGGGSPTPVVAPPPAGVSAEVWRVAFSDDGRLYRPDGVVLMLPAGTDSEVRTVFAEAIAQASAEVEGKTPLFLGSGPANAAIFDVRVNADLRCQGATPFACTSMQFSAAGKVTSGAMEFVAAGHMRNRPLVLHEVMRTLGMPLSNPRPGIMNALPWANMHASDEERLMIRGRYNYPLLSTYAAAAASSH